MKGARDLGMGLLNFSGGGKESTLTNPTSDIYGADGDYK